MAAWLPLLLSVLVGASTVWSAGGPVVISGLRPDAQGNFDADQCRACDADRAVAGLCTNACAACRDVGRTTFAGDNATIGCSQFDGNAAVCGTAWQRTGTGTPVSCFFHAPSTTCLPCSGDNQLASLCTNSCFPCADAARTTFTGAASPDSCRTLDGNQGACEAAWQLVTFASAPTSCFFHAASNQCRGCEVGARLAGGCTNECSTCADSSRQTATNDPADEACLSRAGDQSACEDAWLYTAGYVPSPCFFTPGTEVNQGGFLFIQDAFDRMGPLVTNGKRLAVCLGCNGNTAAAGFDKGFDESTLPGVGWTRATITDPPAIEAFFGASGTTIADAGIVYMPSVSDDSGHFGIVDVQAAVVTAHAAALAAHVAGGGGLFALDQTRLVGGFAWLATVLPGAGVRHGSTCREGMTFTAAGAAVFPNVTNAIRDDLRTFTRAYFVGSFGTLDVLAEDLCRDVTCKDPAHTTVAGSTPTNAVCSAFDGNAALCDAAWHIGGRNGWAAPCSVDGGRCISCARDEFGIDPCPNTCPACDDPARTNYTGDGSSAGCEGLAADTAACAVAWQGASDGTNASCFFDVAAGFCRVCSTESENLGLCTNSCDPPPATRAIVIGLGSTGTPTTTTSTTIPPGTCDGPPAPTFESIDCRLDELIALVQTSTDLGRTKKSLEKSALKARDRKIRSEQLFYAGGKRKKIKNFLHKASRKMVSFNFRVRSLVGRKQIGPETRAALRALGEPILVDMRTLLKSL